MRRAIAAAAILLAFSFTAHATEPEMADRHGPGTQWYQPYGSKKRVKVEQTHQRAVRHVRKGVQRVTEVVTGGSMTTIRAQSGATAVVAKASAPKFQALVDKLEESGTKIKFMGGLRKTKIAGTRIWSKHASGNAIDVCQVARNRVTCSLPSNATQIAASVGLLHGAVWRHPDAGHFEVTGGSRYSMVKRGNRQYAVAWQ